MPPTNPNANIVESEMALEEAMGENTVMLFGERKKALFKSIAYSLLSIAQSLHSIDEKMRKEK